jgi:cytochrome c-type biogenesis protein CcsB
MNRLSTVDTEHSGPTSKQAAAAFFYVTLAISVLAIYLKFHRLLDDFDTAILIGFGMLVAALGYAWWPMQRFFLGTVAIVAIASVAFPGTHDATGYYLGGHVALHSQSLVLATGLAVWLASAVFLIAWIMRAAQIFRLARGVTWVVLALGVLAFLLRWEESYALANGSGHIPVSNLYEVFLVFVLLTSAMTLYLIDTFNAPELATFSMPVVSAAVCFLFWYGATRGASSIQPLIPALQSYWMKLHVPANFIAYGAFSIAAMSSAAWLSTASPFFARRLPSRSWIEEITYRAIAVGFVFFTIATILGAMWAAEAWGGYWSWDPKETWALVVWLNYAAWLHMRLVKQLRGALLAWWSLIGLLVTIFAFLGVNMYLAGLHSYGKL